MQAGLRVNLVGVSCVGTTTIGGILADRRGWPFFDLDEEIERHFGTSIERLQEATRRRPPTVAQRSPDASRR